MSSTWSRSVKDLAENIRDAEGNCVFLIGAGFSKSSGIPLAGALIQEIKEQYPQAYVRSKKQNNHSNYNSVMAQLTPSQRTKLLNKYIEKARVNWAHLALAQMFKNDYIDRILTVNFDPLIVHACAMTNRFPAIYDLATSSEFKNHRVAPKSVFFLNGQHTGFVTLNAESELDKHRQRLRAIVQSTGVKRTWVIVGYSGDADPLLDILAEQPCFDGGLFWVGYDKTPSPDVKNKLLDDEKEAFFISNQDADKFMTELAQELDSFPPSFLVKPFNHLEELSHMVDFSTGDEIGTQHQKTFQAMIKQAQEIQVYEGAFDPESALLSGDYQEVIDWYTGLVTSGKEVNTEQKESVYWAYIRKGAEYGDHAKEIVNTDISKARELLCLSAELFESASEVKADNQVALFNLGAILSIDARTFVEIDSDLDRASMLLRQASEKYKQSLDLRPNDYKSLINWGNDLRMEAEMYAESNLDRSKILNQKAIEKYEQVLATIPEDVNALVNLSSALLVQHGITKQRRFLDQARSLLETVETIKEGQGAYNLACISAQLGDVGAMIEWLETSKTANLLPTKEYIARDKDLDIVRNQPEFIDWLKTAYPD